MNRLPLLAVAMCCLAVAPDADPGLDDPRFVVIPGDPTGLRKPKGPCREDSDSVSLPENLSPPYDRATSVDGCTRKRAFQKADFTRYEWWTWERVDGRWSAFTTSIFEWHAGWYVEEMAGYVTVGERNDAGVWTRRTSRTVSPERITQYVEEHHLDGGERFDVRREQWVDGGWEVLEEFESAPCHHRPINRIIQRQ